MHSFREVLWGALIADFEALPVRDFGMGPGGFGLQLEHRRRPGSRHLASEPDELLVPHVQLVLPSVSGGDPLEEAVPLLQHPLQACQRAGIAGFDLHQHLVEEPAPQLWASLDEAEVVGPEQGDAKTAR